MDKKTIMLPYDFDTALGINNEGALSFSPFLEDTDHTESGADVFNGQQSALWNNMREAFFDDIKAMYQSLRSSGKLSYEVVLKRFVDHQSKWSEAIFNEDARVKYIDPWTDTNDATYLPMCQGAKSSQLKGWLEKRFAYDDSKYDAGEALSEVIQIRAYAKDDIKLKSAIPMYIRVRYGSSDVKIRAAANTEYTMVCNLDNLNDTEVYIYLANWISELGDISGLKPGLVDISKALRITRLKVGDGSADYSNGNLTSLTFGNNTQLEYLDARNSPNLVMAIDMSGCIGLKEAYFDGTGVAGVTFANGGIIEKIHLPKTIANLTLRNQTKISEFVVGSADDENPYSNISTLWLEGVPTIDSKAIVTKIPENTRLRLVNFYWEAVNGTEILALLDIFDKMRGLDENGNNMDSAQISGTIHTSSLTGQEISVFNSRYPHVSVIADHTEATLYYMNEDDTVNSFETIYDGGDGTRTNNISKAATAQYTYTPNGWSLTKGGSANSNALKNVTADRKVYPAYTQTVRTYTVYYVVKAEDNNGTQVTKKTVTNVPYGGSATYDGETPVKYGVSADDYPFKGFVPDGKNITGNTTCYATFGSPVTVEAITDSWDAMIANVDDELHSDLYKVGNYKELPVGKEGPVNQQIVAVDNEEAPLVFLSMEILKTSQKMNTSGDTKGGIEAMAINNYLNNTILPLVSATIPEDCIAPIEKITCSYDADGNKVANMKNTLKLWQASVREIFNSSNYESEGPTYNAIYKDAESRKKMKVGKTTTDYWWLRSAHSTTYFRGVDGGGSGYNDYANYASGVVFGFGIRGHRRALSAERVAELLDSGTLASELPVGCFFDVDAGSLGTLQLQVLGYGENTDELADGSGHADVAIALRNILPDTMKMNNTNDTKGGYSAMPSNTTVESYIDLLPEALKERIPSVKKYTRSYDANGSEVTDMESNHKLFILSYREVFGGSSYETKGPVYTDVFKNATARKKRRYKSASTDGWWLRSAYSTTGFRCVYSGGGEDNNGAYTTRGVAFGFDLIRKSN